MNDGQTSTEIPGVAINNSKFLENLDFPAPCENAEVTGGSTTPDMNERQAVVCKASFVALVMTQPTQRGTQTMT
jgi:hypothetical protein